MLDDKRIGKKGEYTPKVCAVSGERLHRRVISYSLGGGYYFGVIARHQQALSDDTKAELQGIVDKHTSKRKLSKKAAPPPSPTDDTTTEGENS